MSDPEFRAWHIAEKKMYSVVMISWRLGVVECLRIGMGLETLDRFRLKEVILLQDTTLRDKGGKGDKLFAGDVIRIRSPKLGGKKGYRDGVIEWFRDGWVINDEKHELITSLWDYVTYEDLFYEDKQGNIYENPKLMDNGKE